MRPQDVLVLLKLVVLEVALPREATGLDLLGAEQGNANHLRALHAVQPWKQLDLARELGLSQTEISDSLNRNRLAGLVDSEKRRPMRRALTEFLLHGLRYVFPIEPGRVVRGMPTAHSAPPLSKVVVSEDKYVWPDEVGELRGEAIEPLYPTVPHAARRDARLYELLALTDAIRVGRAREQKLAREELERRLLEARP